MKVSSLESGLLGRWMLDAKHGARDISGYENHGTAQGGLVIGNTTDRHGQAGGATEFILGTKYVTIPETTLLKTTGYSICFWYKPTVSNADNTVFGRMDAPADTSWCDFQMIAQRIKFLQKGDLWQVAASIPLNEWHHYVFTVLGATGLLYKDAVSQTPPISTATDDFVFTTLGATYGGYSAKGHLADFRIYNRALTQTEITLLYDSYKPATVLQSINESGLLLHLDAGNKSSYPGTGATWKDLSGNGYNATLVHAPVWSSAGGGSFAFDGANDCAYTTATAFTANTPFTISVWAKDPNAFISRKVILANKQDWATGQGVALETAWGGNGPYWLIVDTVTQNAVATVSSPYTWKNFVLTRRSDNKMYVYNNGVYVGWSATVAGTVTDQYNFFALAATGDFNRKYAFSLAQFLVYQREFSVAEILQNYNATKGRFGL